MNTTRVAALGLSDFYGLPPAQIRALLPTWLGAFVAGGTACTAHSALRVRAAIDGLSDDALTESMQRLATTGSDYGYFPADPGARVITRAFMHSFAGASTVSGISHLAAAALAGPVLLLCNHMAYCDTVLKDMVLQCAGAANLADRLIAIAGPKVYQTLFRRMASLAIGTIKTAQSTSIGHGEGGLSPRAVAEIAVRTVGVACEQMRSGGLVVLYGEGSRSRDQRLGPFIKGIRKYARLEGCQVVPLALSGTDALMPIGQNQMFTAAASLQIGEAVSVDGVGPMAAIERAWYHIAEMLPERHQPRDQSGPWG